MVLEKLKEKYIALGQYLGATFCAPTKRQGELMLFLIGVALIVGGLSLEATAQGSGGGGGGGHAITYNDARLANSINALFTYLEGTFGALVMVTAGVGAIMSAATGQYKAALGLLIVAVGAFILRSVLSTFFNDTSIGA